MEATKNKTMGIKLILELLCWCITGILAYLIVQPLMKGMSNDNLLYPNVLFFTVFLTYTRYIFTLKYTFLAELRWLKVVLIFLSIPLGFHLIELIIDFNSFLDNKGLPSFDAYFKASLGYEEKEALISYVTREMMFFGVASVLATVILPFRLLISVWRVYNKTGKV